ncbi:flagellar hook-length control protein FliK [Marinobacter sp. VGCF2001]|uniref:flagellar hook-length control protein FliK n=1 Tax=Marinobacter sp. VGCF2001 TaxID=3417189 RepID=UPI003CE95CF8
MQQTILPQAPAKTSQPEAAPSKPAGPKDTEAGESRFEELSRAEQKRLDARREEHKEQASAAQENKAAERAEEKAQAAGDRPSNTEKPEDATSSASADSPEGPLGEAADDNGQPDSALAIEEPVTPVTFANLQAMFSAASGQQAVDTPVSLASNLPLGGSQAAPGLVRGQPGQSQSGNGSALIPGMQLTDLLTGGATGESSRPVDPSSLLTTPRFQNVMEAASQQSNPAGKLVADANVPLRGYTTSVDVPVGQAEWGDKVMGKLSWLTARNMSVAEIHLTPPDMGPMEVKVKVHHDQASVTVHAANPVVREQLEQNSHRLRDMLGEQGLSLGQFDVSDQPGQQSGGGESGEAGDGDAHSRGGTSLASQDAELDPVGAGQLDLGWRGEVDVFA